MIRVHLNPSIIESLNFNKNDEILEIEFKPDVNPAECIDISMSILKDYVNSIKPENTIETKNNFYRNLRVVYSNFKAS
ncbi:hypothetical protein GCM10023311_21300 [Flaviramulus aquimarinus]|uniref:Uncharacterized protein n=1 Tax=Flaviramulus aquimarinus TaxID=1170456 RepID=A0ABP9F937_9FLAO